MNPNKLLFINIQITTSKDAQSQVEELIYIVCETTYDKS